MKKFIAGLIIGLLLATAGVGIASSDVIRIFVDGKEVVSDVPPQIINGRTMVPIRFVAEALDASVYWDGERRAVVIAKNKKTDTSNDSNVHIIDKPEIKLGTFIVGGNKITAFYKEINDDILISVYFVNNHLLSQFNWSIDHNGYIYDTRARDEMGEPISAPAGKVTVHKYDNLFLLVSINEINRKADLNIRYDSDINTFYIQKEETSLPELQIEPVPLGTPITKDGITVTVQRIERVEQPRWGQPFEVNIYFNVTNNSERVLRSGRLGPATGSLFYLINEKRYEDEFNAHGFGHIGDVTSWVYPGQTRSIGYTKFFHSPVTIRQITWTGTFADDQTEIELGPWEIR